MNDEEFLKNYKDLQLKLSDLRDPNNGDIDSQSLFKELKRFPKFTLDTNFPQNTKGPRFKLGTWLITFL